MVERYTVAAIACDPGRTETTLYVLASEFEALLLTSNGNALEATIAQARVAELEQATPAQPMKVSDRLKQMDEELRALAVWLIRNDETGWAISTMGASEAVEKLRHSFEGNFVGDEENIPPLVPTDGQ